MMKSCGSLESDPRPNLSVWHPEDRLVLRIPAFFAVVASLCYVVYAVDPVRFAVLRPPDSIFELFFAGLGELVFAITYFMPLGCLVWYCGVPVAFTRKSIHIYFISIQPMALYLNGNALTVGLARAMYVSIVWNSLSSTLVRAVQYLQPVRRYCWPLKMAFACGDRSEDRPYTNLWLTLQGTANTVIGVPMIQYLVTHDKPLLVFVPYIALALGDGFAEPVGKLFGKHKYETRALFTDKKFTRSYEGSATVFFFALVAVFIASSQMNWAQLVLCILTIPIANTLAEAWSPHTMDNHMMLGITWLLLWLIFDVLPLE